MTSNLHFLLLEQEPYANVTVRFVFRLTNKINHIVWSPNTCFHQISRAINHVLRSSGIFSP